MAVPSENCYTLDVNLFAQHLLEGQITHLDQPPICLQKRALKGELLIDPDISLELLAACDQNVDYENKEEGLSINNAKITSYTQLYSSDYTSDKDVEVSSSSAKGSSAAFKNERKANSTSSSTDNSTSESTNSVSLVQNGVESILAMNGIDWGNCLYNDEENWESNSCLLRSERNIFEKISPDWFLPSCLKKAASVHAK